MRPMKHPGSTRSREVRRILAALTLAAGAAGLPSLAGQASTTFQVSITVVPGPTSCSTGMSGGAPQIQCGPAPPPEPNPGSGPGTAPVIVVAGSGVGASDGNDGNDPLRGYRLPDTRMKLAGALAAVGEESFHAWGEYSSRLVAAGGFEYLEMTVTW